MRLECGPRPPISIGRNKAERLSRSCRSHMAFAYPAIMQEDKNSRIPNYVSTSAQPHTQPSALHSPSFNSLTSLLLPNWQINIYHNRFVKTLRPTPVIRHYCCVHNTCLRPILPRLFLRNSRLQYYFLVLVPSLVLGRPLCQTIDRFPIRTI
jgi:hypothetical protein